MESFIAAYGIDDLDVSDMEFDVLAYDFAAELAQGVDAAFPLGPFAFYPTAGAFADYPPLDASAAFPTAGASAAYPASAFSTAAFPAAADADDSEEDLDLWLAELPFHDADLPLDFFLPGLQAAADPTDDDAKDPWILVASRKVGRTRRQTPEVSPPAPSDDAVQVEVPCGIKTGSRRSVQKRAQAEKSHYVLTDDGPGVYVWGSMGPSSLEY